MLVQPFLAVVFIWTNTYSDAKSKLPVRTSTCFLWVQGEVQRLQGKSQELGTRVEELQGKVRGGWWEVYVLLVESICIAGAGGCVGCSRARWVEAGGRRVAWRAGGMYEYCWSCGLRGGAVEQGGGSGSWEGG